jgi:hypothetical protein
MDDIKPEDISIDMNMIKLDTWLSYKLVTQLLRSPTKGTSSYNSPYEACLDDTLLGTDTESITESYYFPEYASPYIRQPSDEQTETESESIHRM